MRPVIAELRRLDVAAAETGEHELHRRAEISVAVVGVDPPHVHEVLDSCERLVAERPELELLSARRRVLDDEDLDD